MTGETPDEKPLLRSRKDAGGRYVHPWVVADDTTRGLRDVLRWQLQRMRHGVPPNPAPGSFDVAVPAHARPRADADELRITWIGHSTFLVQLGRINILTDPVWSRRASPVSWAGPARMVSAGVAFDDLPPIDVVLLSHDHYDHLDAPTVRRLHARYGDALQWVSPLGHRAWLRRRGVHNIAELDWWEHAALHTAGGTLDVHATPAQHWSKRTPFNERMRLWSSFVIASATARVFFCGDSGYFDGFKVIGTTYGPFAAALLPIGAYEPRWFMKPAHMNPAEAVQTYMDLGGTGTFAGMHWGTFRITDEPAFEPRDHTMRAWHERGLPPDQLWVPRHGETRIISTR